MKKLFAKLFAKLLGYTYLERYDCLLTTKIENNEKYKEAREAVKEYAKKHTNCFFSENFDEYLELYALLASMESKPYLIEEGNESEIVTLSNGKTFEAYPIPTKLVTSGQMKIMCETDNHWI